jgi:hypothetical protein
VNGVEKLFAHENNAILVVVRKIDEKSPKASSFNPMVAAVRAPLGTPADAQVRAVP